MLPAACKPRLPLPPLSISTGFYEGTPPRSGAPPFPQGGSTNLSRGSRCLGTADWVTGQPGCCSGVSSCYVRRLPAAVSSEEDPESSPSQTLAAVLPCCMWISPAGWYGTGCALVTQTSRGDLPRWFPSRVP